MLARNEAMAAVSQRVAEVHAPRTGWFIIFKDSATQLRPTVAQLRTCTVTSAQQVHMNSACKAFPRVKAVRAYARNQEENKESDAGQGADCHDVARNHWINGVVPMPIANPMSVWPQYAGARTSWGINALGSCICEVNRLRLIVRPSGCCALP